MSKWIGERVNNAHTHAHLFVWLCLYVNYNNEEKFIKFERERGVYGRYFNYLLLLWLNTMIKGNMGMIVIFDLYMQNQNPLRETKVGTSTSLRGRSWCWGHGRVLLITDFLHMSSLACFLIGQGLPSQGRNHPKWAGLGSGP